MNDTSFQPVFCDTDRTVHVPVPACVFDRVIAAAFDWSIPSVPQTTSSAFAAGVNDPETTVFVADVDGVVCFGDAPTEVRARAIA
jgi:hypothetical protein